MLSRQGWRRCTVNHIVAILPRASDAAAAAQRCRGEQECAVGDKNFLHREGGRGNKQCDVANSATKIKSCESAQKIATPPSASTLFVMYYLGLHFV